MTGGILYGSVRLPSWLFVFLVVSLFVCKSVCIFHMPIIFYLHKTQCSHFPSIVLVTIAFRRHHSSRPWDLWLGPEAWDMAFHKHMPFYFLVIRYTDGHHLYCYCTEHSHLFLHVHVPVLISVLKLGKMYRLKPCNPILLETLWRKLYINFRGLWAGKTYQHLPREYSEILVFLSKQKIISRLPACCFPFNKLPLPRTFLWRGKQEFKKMTYLD